MKLGNLFILTLLALGAGCADPNDTESVGVGASPLRTARRALTVCAKGCDFDQVQTAVDAALSGDVVRVFRGNYAGPIVVQKGLTLRGDGPRDTSLTGGAPVLETRCTGAAADIAVEGMTITSGGGVLNTGCALTLRDAIVTNNATHGSGAGIRNEAGRIVLSDVKVTSNTARVAGGGLYNAAGAVADVRDGMFATNTAGTGAGGGVFNEGTLTIRDSVLRGNAGKLGGGAFNGGTLTLRDSSVVDNTATVNGGGIENTATLRLRGARVARNSAGHTGGGVSSGEGSTLSLSDTSIRNNTPDDCAGAVCPLNP